MKTEATVERAAVAGIAATRRAGRPALRALVLGAVVGPALAQPQPQPQPQPSGSLFVFDVQDVPVASGPTVTLTLRETERSADASVVELTRASAQSRAGLGVLVKGFCGLMRARGRDRAAVEQLSDQPLRYRLDFSAAAAADGAQPAPPPVMRLTAQQCMALDQRK